MPIPDLTHLQFAVLDALGAREKAGRELREALKARGIRKTGPAFYQLMARLEEAKFVKGWYEQKAVEGEVVRERRYKILGAGLTAWQEVRDFYLESGKTIPSLLGTRGVIG